MENRLRTVQTLLQSMRRDGMTAATDTYFERPSPARDVSLTLGMLVAKDEPNVLSGNATASATRGAATALRSPTAELLIGSAAGHAVAFALTVERAALHSVAASPPAIERLQRYLINKGVNVLPAGNFDDDPLLVKAVQWRVLEGRGSLEPTWIAGRLTYALRLPDGQDVAALRAAAFGGTHHVETMRDTLAWLDGSDERTSDVELLRLGLENGLVNEKMLKLSLSEIMGQGMNEDLLLKMEYLLHSR